VFRSKSGARLKMLVWDGLGFWLHYRRLEKATFVWPQVNERGVLELSHAQFAVLTQGLDWRRVRIPPRLEVSVT
jgi:transposase